MQKWSSFVVVWMLLAVGCKSAPHVEQGRQSGEPMQVGQSWNVCTLVGWKQIEEAVCGREIVGVG